MRILLQNVVSSHVEVNKITIASGKTGWLLLVGFCVGDTLTTVHQMVNKLLTLRVFPDQQGKTNLSLADISGEIVSVSQFTLYGDVTHGRRPSFTFSLNYHEGEKLFAAFNEYLVSQGAIVHPGLYGADMKVYLINDGPFTMLLDSQELGL